MSLEVKNHLNKKRWDITLLVGTDAVFVVEAKINAPLDPVQDPDSEEFFSSGYGHGIIHSYPSRKVRAYIVLWQKDEAVADRKPDKLRCVAKHWKLLEPLPRSNTNLVEDLFKSLGSFNVRCFAILNPMTDKLKLANDAAGACKVHAVLSDIVSYLKQSVGLPIVKDSSDFQVDGSYIGWDVIRRGADQAWLDFVTPKGAISGDEISWFGYGSDGKMNVGFYCDPSRVKAVQSAMKQCVATFGKVRTDRQYVWIESNGSATEGDKEWFREIFNRLDDCIRRDH